MEDKDQRPQEGGALYPPESGAVSATKTGHSTDYLLEIYLHGMTRQNEE